MVIISRSYLIVGCNFGENVKLGHTLEKELSTCVTALYCVNHIIDQINSYLNFILEILVVCKTKI